MKEKINIINRSIVNIIIPKDKRSIDLLYQNDIVDGNYIVFSFNRTDFDKIIKTGIFELINNQLNVIIDSYEEDEIIGEEKIKALKKIFQDFIVNLTDPSLIYYFNVFCILSSKALDYGTGVFFYF